ncbi:MAG: hypothetical protein NVS4B9_42510 [Ktedonobacteraceae bacterium]
MAIKKESIIKNQNQDEQILYIDPDENITTIRERLEHTSSSSVALVISSLSRLRSHVAWRLLHARAEELGKDVRIVSSDFQIRALAQSVQFKVASSLSQSDTSPANTFQRKPSRSGISQATDAKPAGDETPRKQKRARSPRPYIPPHSLD